MHHYLFRGYSRIPIRTFGFLVFLIALSCFGCGEKKEDMASTLFRNHCATCHQLPRIENLPKHLWKNEVLPDMAARMGIKDGDYDPLKNKSFDEQYAILASKVYPKKPVISEKEWQLLKKFVIDKAPESLPTKENSSTSGELRYFEAKSIDVDSIGGSFISFLQFDQQFNKILLGDMHGRVYEYDGDSETGLKQKLYLPRKTVTGFNEKNSRAYLTEVGKFNPSEISQGRIWVGTDQDDLKALPFWFHRPVHTLVHDLNADGIDEILVSEFGHLTGQLTLVTKNRESYVKSPLLALPGSIRTVVKDMNADGREDIVAMTSQGNEGIFILYQEDGLKFRAEQIIAFDPIYGSSWFELLDYDADGDSDIITVNGDNADKTRILKPYHGLRIFLNDGSNRFTKAFFYPFHGASRSVSKDFDKDGDIDIALISTFPDYGIRPEQSFRYLENKNAKKFEFESYGLPDNMGGRWFLMDSGDVDKDGDEDIILSSFTYFFTPVPKDLSERWKDSNIDILLLENKLNNE